MLGHTRTHFHHHGGQGPSPMKPPALGNPSWARPSRRMSAAAGHNGSSKPSEEALQDYQHVVSSQEFKKLGYEVVDWMASYMEELEHIKPVRPDVKPGYLQGQLPRSAPEQPESWNDVMRDFQEKLLPGVTHWQSPRFFAYFSANTSFPAALADMLAGALNMIGFSWAAGPVSTELEMAMMDWMGELVGLPERFLFRSGGPGGGVIQGTSSEAVLVAMLGARSRAMRGRPSEDKLKLVAYASDQTHSCFKKAAMVLALDHVRIIPTRPEDEWGLQGDALEAAMAKDVADGLIPFYVCATIGTTSSCAVDAVAELAVVSQRHGAWVHVDAAYAGCAGVVPEIREQHFTGLDLVDSYSFNPHKWLLTNFDCCTMWMADCGPVREALSLTPVFLQATGNDLDFKDLQLPLGRKFRSLKLYFVMRMYGAQKLQEYIRHHMALASWFAQQVESHEHLELLAPPRFGLVCFRLRNATNETNQALLERINNAGEVFMIHTSLGGQYTLRFAVGSTSTQFRHCEIAWNSVSTAVDKVLAETSGQASADAVTV